ncbi:MAG: hypothetical protein V3V33_15895 [Candidatus Lokiarchaeia archaeon]
MEEEHNNNVINLRILELEDKLMDLVEISNKYEDIPIPVFGHEMNIILKEIEYLENLIR